MRKTKPRATQNNQLLLGCLGRFLRGRLSLGCFLKLLLEKFDLGEFGFAMEIPSRKLFWIRLTVFIINILNDYASYTSYGNLAAHRSFAGRGHREDGQCFRTAGDE